ncbi:MAG: prepilin-type N-terminal cleavage/methylation domain-containing protein [Candidatus Omnitrophota bacterium]|nr:MAG: prepilin-type N-terminal cleavage/methylation domain-containing protein [Candidatus Omnitrophota bacterium]
MRGRKGFTLVELLIVIIIVGVLAAVSVPMMSANLERARGTDGIAQLGAIRTAERLYHAEHGHYTGTFADLDFDAGDLVGKYYNGEAANLTNTSANNFTANIAGIGDAATQWVHINQDGTITTSY